MNSKKLHDLFGIETEWVLKIAASHPDAEGRTAFIETCELRKISDPSYSIYLDFPRDEKHTPAPPVKPAGSSGALARKYCAEILSLTGIANKPEEKPEAMKNSLLQELSKTMGECIDRGEHLPKKKEESA